MHSSISNSNSALDGILRRAIIALLAGIIATVATLEGSARTFVYRVSKNLSRINQEALAVAETHGKSDGVRKILFVGNSLLLHDVDINELNQNLQPNQNVKQFAIQATTYYDWYFGVRGLLEKGAHPDLIVVCFEPRHILVSSVRNEMFAYYLMQGHDVLEVRRRLSMTVSETFDLMLANRSIFYALRKELRQVLLQRLMPDLPQLTGMIARAPKPLPDSEALRKIGKERLIAMRDIGMQSNTEISLLLMPPAQFDSVAVISEIGREIGMQVFVPSTLDGIGDEDYQPDGYHLNDHGRHRFTKSLIPLLRGAY